MLQCVAVEYDRFDRHVLSEEGGIHNDVLQCVAVFCGVLQCVTVEYDRFDRHVLCRGGGLHNNVLRCVAVRCSVLQSNMTVSIDKYCAGEEVYTIMCCGVLQCVAVCCSRI